MSTLNVYHPYKATPTQYFVIRIEAPLFSDPPTNRVKNLQGPITNPEFTERQENCGGAVYTGVVREIRRYIFDFLAADFEPSFTTLSSYQIREGQSQLNSANPSTLFNFVVNQPFTITKERPVRSGLPLSEDPTERQQQYFLRTPTGGPLIEVYNATGSVDVDVYGSWERALDEARLKIYKKVPVPSVSSSAVDVLIGTYRKYHSNGYFWKIERYTNPLVKGDSFLNGEFLEYYPLNGNIRVEANFKDNNLDGPYREYYADGLIRCQGILVNGKLEGEYTQWGPEGLRQFKAYFVNGTLNDSYVLDYQ